MPSPKHKHSWSEPYRAAVLVRHEMNESNDCVVIALSFATGRYYQEIHEALSKAGRKPGNGMYAADWGKVLRGMGFKMTPVDIRDIIKKFPGRHSEMKNLTTYHPRRFPEVFKEMKGAYLIHLKGHVACMVDGELHDWTAGKLKRVMSVYKVDPDIETK